MTTLFNSISLLMTCLAIGLIACSSGNRSTTDSDINRVASDSISYNLQKTIPLDSFGVIGIADAGAGSLYLSDADNNQLIRISSEGKVTETIPGFERPMHIAAREGEILIAEYGSDQITKLRNGKTSQLPFVQAFDAPSGIDAVGERQVVADFYNHRVVYSVAGEDRSFGSKGDGPGEMTYPTDVQLAHNKIWVADAYNHRVQVFDTAGKHLLTFGEAQEMNAATGLYVSDELVYVTDFENSRVQVYNLDGLHRGSITDHLDKPTDVLIIDDVLYVVNYAGRFLSTYTKS